MRAIALDGVPVEVPAAVPPAPVVTVNVTDTSSGHRRALTAVQARSLSPDGRFRLMVLRVKRGPTGQTLYERIMASPVDEAIHFHAPFISTPEAPIYVEHSAGLSVQALWR